MLTLGIETSCDETAAAVLREKPSSPASSPRRRRSTQIRRRRAGACLPRTSQKFDAHHPRSARRRIGIVGEIDLVAVTYAPGLIGALLVGVSAAKAIAYARGVPFIGVHHGEAHILAAHIEYPGIGYPYIALLVSGGHRRFTGSRAWATTTARPDPRRRGGRSLRQGGQAARPRVSRRSR